MKGLWERHLRYYDFFQNNLDGYKETLNIHLRELTNSNKILDAGAGSGNLAFQLLKKGHEVTAIDSDEASLEVLRKKCEEFNNKLKVRKMDVQKLDLRDNEFDGASSMFVIPFVKDNEKYFGEVYRVLKVGAKFSISAWAPESGKDLMKVDLKELTKKGILPKHKKEWDYINEPSNDIIMEIVEKGPAKEEIIKLLEKAGFKKIKVLSERPYGKYSYFVVCEK